ncbi:MAG: RNA-guided endonuclease InsQ/TnpB family protein [Candidatus Hydrothermarchaeaceae archaeon]
MLQAQIIQAIRRDIWANRKTISELKNYSPSFNIPRSGSFKFTNRNNPIFSIAFNGRIALPIKQDHAWHRFQENIKQGWWFTHFRLKAGQIIVSLKKEFQVREGRNILGVDAGTQILSAITIYNPIQGRILRQLYLGRNIYAHKRNLCIRRSKLRAKADRGYRKAQRALRRIKTQEYNYDKTRCYQVAHEIVRLAKEHEATIALENLNGLKDRRLNRETNRKVKRTPYRLFIEAIQRVAWQNGVAVRLVDPKDTSKTCPKCGHISKGNRKRQSFFQCINCGYEVNADRNASLNIALRAVRHLTPQAGFDLISRGRDSVNSPLCRHEGVVEPLHGPNQLLSESRCF